MERKYFFSSVSALAIECSTVSYQHALDLARELRGRGFIYVDSPVTGLPDAAAAGKLTLLVGAEPADLEKARPYLVPLSTTIRHFGAVGSGTVLATIVRAPSDTATSEPPPRST